MKELKFEVTIPLDDEQLNKDYAREISRVNGGDAFWVKENVEYFLNHGFGELGLLAEDPDPAQYGGSLHVKAILK